MEIISKTTEDTKKLAFSIAQKLKPGDVLALYGDLGSGKTTFTGFLTRALNSTSRVQSPTFVLMRRYKCNLNDINNINHIDLYRLSSINEILDLGFEEILNEKNTLSILEWPELIENNLPKKTIKIKFEIIDENERKINVQNPN
ncbi:MAG: hypothetical protein ACD_24C00023G0001 [uncultured bacterium]|uniref:tRNA threonylcarbamoyladenosine biosynthesis protein TsaE n=1 Tax=candidate division WWE3 bacterium RIFCSPLOWO2_01_FULL_37_15 TaxID=1802622 RepID=A0A1F4UUX4_UNCKA|nr:MAG: hypothetical protein ACD_24C00023G0001 [uncultured bacterium]OGC48758.1 MAG: tRNA (adenosine(37)-N6)-threonylcarbamoyltransferase complex ATPase subunit type 1 TsaE [candidate division WWE3 bacterium RIFCSPLOWO2_01_FULL_37_15]